MTQRGRRAASRFRQAKAALIFGAAMLWPLCGNAQWFFDLHQAALQADPGVTGAQAQVRAAEERVYQARAAFGPTATIALSKSDTHYNEAPSFDSRRFSSKEAVLQITQPLVRNSLFPTLDSALAQLEQAQSALDQVKADASVRLIESCFDALKARDVVILTGAQLIAAEEQLAAARRSFKVGTTSITDVREAEAKIDTVLAQRIAADADFELRQQLLQELVGRPTPDIANRALTGDQMPALPPASVIEWLLEAQAQSPQLRQAQQALIAANAEVVKAWQGHTPTADLIYSYTMSSDTGTVTSIFPRRGNASQIGINVNIPLFAGGATQAKVREAVAVRDKAQSDVDAVRRTVQIAVRQNFSAALTSVALSRGLETANRSLEVSFQANRRGYEVGLKTNSEVLEAQSKLFEARRDLSRARYDAWLNFLKLRASAGQMALADIEVLDRSLVDAEPRSVRGRLTSRGTPP